MAGIGSTPAVMHSKPLGAKQQDTRSYSEQFADIQKSGGDLSALCKNPYPKPSKDAQARVPGAKLVPFSDNLYTRKEQRPLMPGTAPPGMSQGTADRLLRMNYYIRPYGFVLFHAMVLVVAPFTFSWNNLAVALVAYMLTNMFGICLAYHRLLTHRSFKCPMWLEYVVAWLGCHAVQGDPIEWVSNHRQHHLHTDTPLDPHSPYEGFWWSHMGWLVADPQSSPDRHFLDRTNAADLSKQTFYQWLEATWVAQVTMRFFMTWMLFGVAGLVWSMLLPIVVGWHAAFFVNSAAHVWGYQTYETGDLSTNNWWVALIAGGEGWHNTHHAFPYSARHGLEPWEFDLTWCLICGLEALGLAWDIELPAEKQKAAKLKVVKAANTTPAAAPGGKVADMVVQVKMAPKGRKHAE